MLFGGGFAPNPQRGPNAKETRPGNRPHRRREKRRAPSGRRRNDGRQGPVRTQRYALFLRLQPPGQRNRIPRLLPGFRRRKPQFRELRPAAPRSLARHRIESARLRGAGCGAERTVPRPDPPVRPAGMPRGLAAARLRRRRILSRRSEPLSGPGPRCSRRSKNRSRAITAFGSARCTTKPDASISTSRTRLARSPCSWSTTTRRSVTGFWRQGRHRRISTCWSGRAPRCRRETKFRTMPSTSRP